MVSTPTLAEAAGMDPATQKATAGAVNKVIDAIYPPGSIVKPLLYAGAVTDGAIPLDLTAECKGHFFDNVTTSARCWIWRPEEGRTQTHGTLAVDEAIARSCNIFFYTVAAKLGLDRVVEWYRRYGVGAPLGLGLGVARDDPAGGMRIEGEAPGVAPSAADIAAIRSAGDQTATVFLGIGQGPVAWTPLHAANAYATLARGGAIVRPGVILDRPDRGAVSADLGLDQAAVRKALEGLRQAVMEPFGTGNHITLESGAQEPLTKVPGVRIWAKTGTAQAPPFRVRQGSEGSAEAPLVRTDHAWFVGLVGNESDGKPRYAIAVIVEYGGSGGKTAGPIAAAIVRGLRREGYLGAAADAESGQ
jgi:penicillin-binding protein 2